ncbi:MAG: heme lyase CcmF/NrfE family subunit, partial [Alphaproteobacteria bacterium]
NQNFHNIYQIYLSLAIATFLIAISSQLFLIYSFVISDYSVINVYQNSHHLKPLLYKIAGSWGNHEGSMLLLITTLCAFNLGFAFFSNLPKNFKILNVVVMQFVIGLFCAYTLFTSNPFLQSFPAPKTGLGLNPILQDIGLALHPPMLYAGYLGFSLIYSLTISALILPQNNFAITRNLLAVSYFSTAILTIGIALGSWWAYRELGWGGYWFWDPVENISLMPWLAGIILIHALKYSKQNFLLKIWSDFFAIITMILCLIGIFLTRSGVLTSVHSFAISANRGFFIIVLIGIIGGFGLFILAKFHNFKQFHHQKSKKISKVFFIIANNYFLPIALLVILIGTLYPILSRGLFNQSISIHASYYNQVFSLLLIPFLIFLVGNFFQSKRHFFTLQNLFLALFSTIITTLILLYLKQYKILLIANLFLAIYALMLNFFSRQKISGKLAHGGFLLIILGIIISSFGNRIIETNLKVSQSFKIADYSIKFSHINYLAGKNYISRIGVFAVSKNNNLITNLQPELRLFPISDQITNESAIYHHLFYDLYLVIGTKDDQENYAIRAYFKPMINLIWLGVLLIFFALKIQILKLFFKKP